MNEINLIDNANAKIRVSDHRTGDSIGDRCRSEAVGGVAQRHRPVEFAVSERSLSQHLHDARFRDTRVF